MDREQSPERNTPKCCTTYLSGVWLWVISLLLYFSVLLDSAPYPIQIVLFYDHKEAELFPLDKKGVSTIVLLLKSKKKYIYGKHRGQEVISPMPMAVFPEGPG